MKKIIALLLVALFVCGALAACGGSQSKDAATADQKKDFKAGFIFLHDENSTYDLNFINAAKAACEKLGVECILKTNIDESNACKETALDLVDQGCGFVFADSFGHESYMIEAAKANPKVQFSHATGTMAHTEKLDNYHNAFASIYEGRYLAGVAAGLKLNEMIESGKITAEQAKIGYVGAYTYADVSYNGSTLSSCPNTFIVSSRIDWTPYFEYAIKAAMNGDKIDTDWTGTLGTKSVVLTEVNEKAAAKDTQAKIDEVKAKLESGELHVFDTKTFTVNGEALTSYKADVDTDTETDPAKKGDTEVIADGYFHESENRSAPYFDVRIDGITLLNEKF